MGGESGCLQAAYMAPASPGKQERPWNDLLGCACTVSPGEKTAEPGNGLLRYAGGLGALLCGQGRAMPHCVREMRCVPGCQMARWPGGVDG